MIIKSYTLRLTHDTNMKNIIEPKYNEYLKLLRWLYQLDTNLLLRLNTSMISHSCWNIVEVFQLKLNEKESELFMAAINGDRTKIEQLIKEKVDYTILDHYLFKKSCYDNKIVLACRLAKLDRESYNFQIEDKKIIKYKAVDWYQVSR